MAAICAMRLGSSDVQRAVRAEWDGEEWTYEILPKPEAYEEVLWELEQIEAESEFGKTQAMVFRDLAGEDPPYNHRLMSWVTKSIMDRHVGEVWV